MKIEVFIHIRKRLR